MADERIQAVIQVQADVEQARRAFEQLSSAVAGLTQETSAQARAAQEAQTRMAALTGTARTLGVGLAAVGAAGAALTTSNVMLAARVQTLGVVVNTLGRNLGYTATQMAAFERSVRSQGITTQAARQSLALMAQANLDLSKAADLARIAQNAAVIAGIDSSEAFQRLVYAISSGQTEMLRTMSIQVSFAEGLRNMADASGRTTAQLTAVETAASRMNSVLAAAPSIAGAYTASMDTAGKQMASLNRLVEEARLSLGEGLLPVFSQGITTATSLLTAFNSLDDSMKQGIGSGIAMASAISGVSGAALLFLSNVPRLVAGIQMAGTAMQTSAGPIGIMAAAIGALITMIVAHEVAERAELQTLQAIASGAESAAGSYQDYRRELIDTARSQFDLAVSSDVVIDADGRLVEIWRGRYGIQRRVIDGVTVLTGAQWELENATEGVTGAGTAEAAALTAAQLAAEGLAGGLGDVASAADGATGALQVMTDANILAQLAADAHSITAGLLRDAINSLRDRHVVITVDTIRREFQYQVRAGAQGIYAGLGADVRAAGGPLREGRWTLVGEAGAELISPAGVVVPHAQTQRLLHTGRVRPATHHMIDWGAVGTYTPTTTTNPAAAALSTAALSFIPSTYTNLTPLTPTGGGGTAATSAAATVAAIAAQIDATVIGSTAAIVAAMPQPEQTALAVSAPARAQIAEQLRSNVKTHELLEDIKDAVLRLGTANDMSRAVMDGISRTQG